MYKLSKEETARRDEIIEDLKEQKEKMEAEWAKVVSAVAAFNTTVAAYNAELGTAQTFVDDIVGQMEDYMNDKSEKWTDGDKGQAYDAWKSEWEGVDLSEIAAFELDEHTASDAADHHETLENLPDRPE